MAEQLPDLREDTMVYPTMVKLAGCLATEFIASGLGQPCFCGLFPGEEAPWDYCDGNCGKTRAGQIWVRLVSAFPTQPFPVIDPLGTCASAMGFDLEVGAIRAAPMITGTAAKPILPTVDAQLESTRIQLAEMAAIRRAIKCCMAENEDGGEISYALGSYSPVGPDGGCVGGSWTVTVSTRS